MLQVELAYDTVQYADRRNPGGDSSKPRIVADSSGVILVAEYLTATVLCELE